MDTSAETKWTPGPWRLEAGTGHHAGTWVITAEGMRSNTPLARLSDFDDAAAHDAHLIAAAPELFEALYEARTDLMIAAGNADNAAKTDPRWEGVGAKLRARVEQCDAALAKARGGHQ